MKKTYKYFYIFLLIFFDILAVMLSFEVAKSLRTDILDSYLPFFMEENAQRYYWIVFIVPLMFAFEKIYFIRYDFWTDIKRVYKSLLLAFVIAMTILTLTKVSEDYSRAFIVLFFVVLSFIVPFFKRVVKKMLFRFDIFKIEVKILADQEQYSLIKTEFIDNWYFGYIPAKENFDMVLISSKNFKTQKLQELIEEYSNKTKDIFIIPYMSHLDISHATIVDYSNIRLSAIHLENKLLNYKNIILKTLFEYFLTFLIAPLMFLVHFVIYFAIRFDSKGEVFFKQKRFGKDGKVFLCYKYRTMYQNSDEILKKYLQQNPDEVENYNIYHKYKNDPRVTKVGKVLRKLSLDELPQLINLLKGEMALIGPRPYMINESEKLGNNKKIILKVKPGLTGLWQVSGRNELTFEQRVKIDIWYIQNWNLWLDFIVFIKTFKVILDKTGAK